MILTEKYSVSKSKNINFEEIVIIGINPITTVKVLYL